MLRILGFCLIVAGSLGIGFSICEKHEKRILNLKEWKYALEIIVNEIRYKRQPVLFVFKECGKLLKGETGEVLRMIPYIYEKGETDIRVVWESCIKSYVDKKITALEDKKLIKGLCSVVGFDEEEMQINMLNMKIEQFNKYISELEEEKRLKNKITILLSSCSGIVLALLLI